MSGRDVTRAVELLLAERDKVAELPHDELVRRYGMTHRKHLFGLITESRPSDSPESIVTVADGPEDEYDISIELWPNDDGPGEVVVLEIRETRETLDQARAWFHVDPAGNVGEKGHRLLGERGDFSRIPDDQ